MLWIIEFYSDQCPMCKSLVPEILQVRGETGFGLRRNRGCGRCGAIHTGDLARDSSGAQLQPSVSSVCVCVCVCARACVRAWMSMCLGWGNAVRSRSLSGCCGPAAKCSPGCIAPCLLSLSLSLMFACLYRTLSPISLSRSPPRA